MNKFIDKKKKTTKKQTVVVKEKELKPNIEVLTLGTDKFIICPKCGWQHVYEEEKCRFCGKILRG